MKYIICGLEHVGLRVADLLLGLNHEVSLITLDKHETDMFHLQNKISRYVEGDARNIETLLKSGVSEAHFFLIFTSNQLKNLEINCKVKELNPKIKTAVLIQNLSYAKIIEKGFDVDWVFHLPSIVNWPIVSACINKNVIHAFHTDKNKMYVGVISCDDSPVRNKTIQEIETDYSIKIIDYIDKNNPSDRNSFFNQIVTGGILVYMSEKDIQIKSKTQLFQLKKLFGFGFSESTKRFNIFNKFSISPGIRKVLIWYCVLILISIIIFIQFLHLSFVDAFYFVITTTTTVGFGDFNLKVSPTWIKLFGSFTMLAGAAMLAVLFSVITDNLITRRLGRYIGVNKKIKDHVIVAGLGSIGLEVVNSLSRLGIKTVAIERNAENPAIPSLHSKVPLIIGDASDQKNLIKAGIKNAKTLAALIDDDLNNINILLKGNILNDNLNTVARIFSNDLHNKTKSTFQIDNVISASQIAAPHILSRLVCKDTIWSGYLDNKVYAIVSLTINSSNPPTEMFIKKIHESGLIPLLINRNNELISIDSRTQFLTNDLIYLYGEYNSLVNMSIFEML